MKYVAEAAIAAGVALITAPLANARRYNRPGIGAAQLKQNPHPPEKPRRRHNRPGIGAARLKPQIRDDDRQGRDDNRPGIGAAQLKQYYPE